MLESRQDVPLTVEVDGTIRIAGTRVSLESVVCHYDQGATAEEIVLRFPALPLADVHACLAYYLNHQEKVHEYLARQRQAAETLRERITADPGQQRGVAQMRERIRQRAATRKPEAS